MENSENPGQMQQCVASGLAKHCLLRSFVPNINIIYNTTYQEQWVDLQPELYTSRQEILGTVQAGVLPRPRS